MRRIACAACLAALVTAGSGASPVRAASIDVVRADASAAARVPVQGPRLRRLLARRLLAGLGADSGVERVRFAWVEHLGPSVTIRVRSAAPHGRVERMRAWWVGTALAGALGYELERRGKWLRASSLVIDGRSEGGSGGAIQVPSAHRWRARPLAAEVERRATALGLDVSGRVLPFAPVMLDVRVRLAEADLFATADGWGTRVGEVLPRPWSPRGRTLYQRMVVIEDPAGRLLSAGASAASSGSGTSGEAGPVPSTPPPAELLDGETRLTLRFDRAGLGGPSRTRTFTLVCGASPSGVADAAAVCDRMLRDRWALFGTLDGGCIGGGIGWPSVSVTGVVDGLEVVRELGRCGSGGVKRWGELLGIDPWTFT